MKRQKVVSALMSFVMLFSCFAGFTLSVSAEDVSNETAYKTFNFTSADIAETIKVDSTDLAYTKEKGYGFVAETSSMPSRLLNTSLITASDDGFSVTEDGSGEYLHNTNGNNYNYGGMVFRVDVSEAGAYGLTVKIAKDSTQNNTSIAVNGTKAKDIKNGGSWDSSGLVLKNNIASFKDDTTWEYDFVTGEKYIEFEIEPSVLPKAGASQTVCISSIQMTKIANKTAAAGEKPTLFILGDSTLKTYTFEEAGMSGYGQVLKNMFDEGKINVINYSMGGRSMKAMWFENRFNDALMTAKEGDFMIIHSAHNDESTGLEAGPEARFGRGSNTQTYTRWLNDIYIPAMKSRGVTPILVTSMPRTNNGLAIEKFNPDAPALMTEAAKNDSEVLLVDLNTNAKSYMAEYGADQVKAIYMSIEAGETPGKTNSGSYANGHPDNKIDGTHYKEAAAKVWCKIIAEEIYKEGDKADAKPKMAELKGYLKDIVTEACKSGDFTKVYPEWTNDVSLVKSGNGSYYRNQIEKLLSLGVMSKDENNNFRPDENMSTNEFIEALCAIWALDLNDVLIAEVFDKYLSTNTLKREVMASIILDAYKLRFGRKDDGTYAKPKYMTDYNGSTVSPDDPTYDPNLTGKEAQYYPLEGWGNIIDKDEISLEYAETFYDVYNLGLMRSEVGIERGKMKNGNALEPKGDVTRAKAAKQLWFLWVLGQDDVKAENQVDTVIKNGTAAPISYNKIEYTPMTYEFKDVNISKDGKLSVSLNKNGTEEITAKLNVKVFDETGELSSKDFEIAADNTVTIDTVVEKGQYVVMTVLNSDGAAVSKERKAVRTELFVPVRSYTVKNTSGIKNGTVDLKNLSEAGNEVNLLSSNTDAEGNSVWTATENVTPDMELIPGLFPTCDMAFSSNYVSHASTNGYLSNAGRERSGFVFTPSSDGVFTADVTNLGNNKNFVIIDDTKTAETEAIASSQTPTVLSGNVTLSAPLKAGVKYYIGVLGSKGRYTKITWTPGAPVVEILAKPGETVEVTANPNENYFVETVKAVNDTDETEVALTKVSDTVYTFVMPESNVTVLASFNTEVNPPKPPIGVESEFGDFNKDGYVTIEDASLILQYVLNPDNVDLDKVDLTKADVDGDNVITAMDASYVIEKALNGAEFLFPVENKK